MLVRRVTVPTAGKSAELRRKSSRRNAARYTNLVPCFIGRCLGDLVAIVVGPDRPMRGSLLVLLAVAMSTPAAADAPAATSRVRRMDRDADADQPPARESEKRRDGQRWEANVANATMSGGGKNAGRKKTAFPNFRASTKEEAESMRDKALEGWLHAPQRAPHKSATSPGTSGDGQGTRYALEPAPPSFPLPDRACPYASHSSWACPQLARPQLARPQLAHCLTHAPPLL